MLLAIIIETMIALKEGDASRSLPPLPQHLLLLLRDPKASSKAFLSAACQHLFKALKGGVANGSLVKALGGGSRGGRGRGRGFDPVGRFLRVLLVSARAPCKFKPTAKSKSPRSRTISASRRKKPAAYPAISGLMEVMRILGAGGTAVRSRAAYPKTSPARKRKSATSSSRTTVSVTPAAKKKSAATTKKGKKELAAAKSKGGVRKTRQKAVTAAARKRTATKIKVNAAPKTKKKRTAERKT